MKRINWDILLVLFLVLTVSVNCQDEDSEDEDEEEETERPRTTTKEPEVVEETASAINQTAISELIQAALNAQKKTAPTTLPPLRTTTKVPAKGNGTETDSVVLSALVQAALKNANRQTDDPSGLKSKKNATGQSVVMDAEQLDFTMRQTNKILEGITRGNVSSVVEEALKIRAPDSVQGIITNMVSLVSGWNGGISGYGKTEQCACLQSDPLYRKVKSEMEKFMRFNRAEDSMESLEYIMSQVSKVMEGVMTGNISNVVENSLRVRAPPTVQKIITNMVTFLRNGIPEAGVAPISDQLCRCMDAKLIPPKPLRPASYEKEIYRSQPPSSPKPYSINPYKKTNSVG